MELNQNHKLSKDHVHTLLTTPTTSKADISKILHNLQEDKHSELTIGMFFEFMKTAYQVKDSFESLATTLSANSEIDWNALAKISLNLNTHNDDATCQDKNTEVTEEAFANSNFICKNNNKAEFSHVPDTEKTNVHNIQHTVFSSESTKQCDIHKKLYSDEEASHLKDKCYNHLLSTKVHVDPEPVDIKHSALESCNQLAIQQFHSENTKDVNIAEETETMLVGIMKKNLSNILHEGLLDSVLPYMIPKSVLSQPNIKKSITNTEIRKTASLSTGIENRTMPTILHKEKDKEKNKALKKSFENEVEIHVCDEDKNIKKNFRCPQKLLIQKMCYFADVTAGQKLEEIDISVHCDVVIFDWLMRWVKKDIIPKSEWPVLEASNVIPIMVSASFLQMEPLLDTCLQYCHNNMSDILKTSTILTCLDDSLLTRLALQFSNVEVEALKDKRDKIQSKLFCKLIMSLAEVTANNQKGHYSSLSTLSKCSKCGKNIIQSVSNHVPCIANAMKIDKHGIIHSKHVRDLTWTLNDYILTLRTELRSWRKVYWRLWGDCHFFFCQECNMYFPVHQMDWCCYHPELPQFFINEQQRPTPFPLGRYPCCSQRAYRFEALPNREGCRYKEHIPEIKTQNDVNILNIFASHREVISIEPPQLFFPEKITRLVARDPSLQPGKLLCKDTMWWAGIELVPQRSKLGLLSKIWSGSGFRRSLQTQDSQKLPQKIRQQVSVGTDDSSPTPSVTDSDEERGTDYDDISVDEDSCYSEESDTWTTLRAVDKFQKKMKSQCTQRNSSRCWSNNLNIRHNQDNQRDFEERAALQMMTLLTKRVVTDSSMLLKSSNKQSWRKNQSIGGTYVKLEAEFREQFNHFYKCKSSTAKSSVRIKSNKS